MKSCVLICTLIILLPNLCLAQSFEKTFSTSTDERFPSQSNYTYVFHDDSTFRYDEYSFSIMKSSYDQHKYFNGIYLSYHNRIVLIPNFDEYYDTTVRNGFIFLYDSIGDRIIDQKTLIDYRTEGGLIRVNKRIALVNSAAQDTSTYYYPFRPFTKDTTLTIDFCKTYFPCLDFLKDVELTVNDHSFDPSISGYDEKGRLTAHCLEGWFNMSSIPTTIEFHYKPDSDLIYRIYHSSIDNYWHDTRPYHEFQYDESGNLTKIKFSFGDDGIVEEYEILH